MQCEMIRKRINLIGSSKIFEKNLDVDHFLVRFLVFCSGACGLVAEVIWSRLAGVRLGFTVTTDSLVLAGVFFGLALGYLVGQSLFRQFDASKIYGYGEIGAAFGALLPLGWFHLLPATGHVGLGIVVLVGAALQGIPLPGFLGLASQSKRRVYGINLLGAACGAMAAIWIGIPFFGVKQTLWLVALIGLICGLLILLMVKSSDSEIGSNLIPEFSSITVQQWLIVGLGGMAIGAGQLGAMMFFSLIFHNSTYTFTLVVTAAILFLSLGATLSDNFSKRVFLGLLLVFGLLALGSGLFLVATWTAGAYLIPDQYFWWYCIKAFVLVSAGTGVFFTLMGMILPAVWHCSSSDKNHMVGVSCCISTSCSGLGALILGGLIANGFVSFAWMFDRDLQGSEILFSEQSRYGLIEVHQSTESNRSLIQNFHYIHGSLRGSAMERRQADIPLLLHRDPKEVLLVGLGTGITAGAVLDHPEAAKITLVELIPEVGKASRLFSMANNNLQKSKIVEWFYDDGRSYLQQTAEQFDVIVVDLVVPWESKSGYLFTHEFYQAAARRLKMGGLLCHWLPLWQLSADQLEVILNTAASVFPQMNLVWGRLQNDKSILGLVGVMNTEPLIDSWDFVQKRVNRLRALRPDPLVSDVIALQKLWLGQWHQRGGQLNTDNTPYIEFWGPRLAPTFSSRLVFENLLKWHVEAWALLGDASSTLVPSDQRRSYQQQSLR